jgi:hypothetical protein
MGPDTADRRTKNSIKLIQVSREARGNRIGSNDMQGIIEVMGTIWTINPQMKAPWSNLSYLSMAPRNSYRRLCQIYCAYCYAILMNGFLFLLIKNLLQTLHLQIILIDENAIKIEKLIKFCLTDTVGINSEFEHLETLFSPEHTISICKYVTLSFGII